MKKTKNVFMEEPVVTGNYYWTGAPYSYSIERASQEIHLLSEELTQVIKMKDRYYEELCTLTLDMEELKRELQEKNDLLARIAAKSVGVEV